MGEVWEATDTLLNRSVAVKILKEEFRTASRFLDRFRAEARHAGQLSHQGIATVFDYGETPELAFLVMELVRGRTLSELMFDEPALETVTKMSILVQAADALQAAHEAGVVHRDVKPGNLMVRDDGTVKVTDFGIARALTSASLTEHGQMIGTPAYVSPEQARGDQVTGASDIYSLGVVAYELFAGKAMFERDTPLALALAHVNEPPPPLPNTVPRGVADLIESALAKDPSLRPPSAARFAADMRREMAMLKSVPSGTVAQSPQDRGATATNVWPSSTVSVPDGSSTLLAPVAVHRDFQRQSHPRRSYVMVAAVVGLLVVIGTAFWVATRSDDVDDLRTVGSVTTTVGASTVATEVQNSTPSPLSTQPLATDPVVPLLPTTVPVMTLLPTTQPLPTPVPQPAVNGEVVQVDESEALAFITDYYDRVSAGDYETTWALLSPEFRNARSNTYENYVGYWERTTIEIGDLKFVPGPGTDVGRVQFAARYTTNSRVIDEIDEITLRREPDGNLTITDQRTV